MSNELIPSESKEIVVGNADALSRVVQKALQQIETILDMEAEDVAPEDLMKLLSVKKDAASSIINAGLKADENRFRRENKDIIEKLYEKIKNSDKIINGNVSRKV